jgi:hypothetical protein
MIEGKLVIGCLHTVLAREYSSTEKYTVESCQQESIYIDQVSTLAPNGTGSGELWDLRGTSTDAKALAPSYSKLSVRVPVAARRCSLVGMD